MKERIQFLLLYYIFWMVYFVSARVIFLVYHIQDTKVLTLELVAGIFTNGLRMDLSMSAYLSVIPFLLVTFSHFIKKSRLETYLFSYTLFLIFALTLIVVIDLEVYNVWKFRLDETPLNYLSSPREAFISASSSPVFKLFLSYLILIAIASYFVYRIISHRLDDWKFIEKFPFLVISFMLTSALIIPMRGSLAGKPLTSGQLFFSTNYFANVSTLNAPWHFIHSFIKRFDPNLNPYSYLPRAEIKNTIEQLYPVLSAPPEKLTTAGKETNVLIIVVESLTSKILTKSVEGKPVTPFLTSLRDSSVYFSNVYASGDHTEKGLVALFNGYPATPTKSIIYDDEKVKKLPFLTKDFSKLGYSSEFYYGGNSAFLNLNNYALIADYQNIIDESSFPDNQRISSWGVYDHDLFNNFLERHAEESGKPFFANILTVSSHEPFEVPGTYLYKTISVENDYYNAMNYVDNSLRDFLHAARQQPWWQNTLIVIVADHGHRFPESGSRFEDNKIPMFWTGGAVTKPNVVKPILSQVDFPKLLLNELNVNNPMYRWSKNSLQKGQPAWAFFTYNDGFGYCSNKGRILFDNLGKKTLYVNPKNNAKVLKRRGQALQQITFNDYLDK